MPALRARKPLQGFGFDVRLGSERLRRRGRGRQSLQLVAAFFEQHPGAVEHGGLSGSGIPLHTDDPVAFGQDQLDRGFLSVR